MNTESILEPLTSDETKELAIAALNQLDKDEQIAVVKEVFDDDSDRDELVAQLEG